MLDHGNGQLSSVGGFLPMVGAPGSDPFFGGGIGGGMSGAFDMSGGKIVNCALVFGRATVECQDTALGILGEGQTPAGSIYARVKHSGTSSLELSVHHTSGDLPENSLDASYRLLYKAVGSGQSAVWADYRYVPTMFAMN